MAIAAVTGQHAKAHSSVAVSSISVSLPSAATPGNSIHVAMSTFNRAQGSTDVSDNQGNGTYAQDAYTLWNQGTYTAAAGLYSKQNVAASGTFTVTWSGSGTSEGPVIFVSEFSGVATASAKDVSNQSNPGLNGTGPFTWTGPSSGALAGAGELVIASTVPVGSGAFTLSTTTSGYSNLDFEQDGTQYVVSGWVYQVVSGTSSQTVAWQDTDTGLGGGQLNPSCIAAYKPASGSSPQTGNPTGKTSSSSLGTVTARPGPVSASVAGKTSSSAFGTVTARSGVVVAVPGKASSSSLGAVTPAGGAASVAVPGKASSSAFGSVTLRSAAAVPVGSLGSQSAFGTVTAVGGASSVAVPGLVSHGFFGSISFSGGTPNAPARPWSHVQVRPPHHALRS